MSERAYARNGGAARPVPVRLAALVLAGGLLAGCSGSMEDLWRPLNPLPPADPSDVAADPQAGAADYPKLSSVPDQPPRRPSRQADRQALRDSLTADRENARYIGDPPQQPSEDRQAAGDGSVPEGAPPAPPEDMLAGAPDDASSEADQETAAGAETEAGSAAGASQAGDRNAGATADEPAQPQTAQPQTAQSQRGRSQTGRSQTGRSQSGDGQAAQAADGQRRSGAGDQAGGTAQDRSQGRAQTGQQGQAMAGVPQIEPSQQGEPIEVPGQAAPRQPAEADSRRAADRTAGRTGAEPPQAAGQSQTFARSQAAGQPAADGGRRVAVIYFAHGSTGLNARDREVLREVARIYERRQTGLRVVGHASSRTAAMDPIDHRMANFETSMERAEAVADALASMGVPPKAIQVEARADREPVYHEFMPTGEAGNRRAEIFVKG